MSGWVNPDYTREVRDDGGITYRRRGPEVDYMELDGVLVHPQARKPLDIVDEVDALVDEQLSGGPVDDYNADRYDRCPHCGRHWHGLPVTERIAGMYSMGQFDEDYRVDSDDTRILCHGSDFIGPMPQWRPDPYVYVDHSRPASYGIGGTGGGVRLGMVHLWPTISPREGATITVTIGGRDMDVVVHCGPPEDAP